MGKTVQIRDLDDATYETLRARAKASDLSLTQYLRRELHNLASTPSMEEILARADRRRARGGGIAHEDLIAALDADRADRR
jgi:antitoxin FitA